MGLGKEKLDQILESSPVAFAYHRMVFDKNQKPVDYIFKKVNKAFENLTGIPRHEIIGRKVTEVFPGIKDDEFNWIKAYGRVATSGETASFEKFFGPLQQWHKIQAFSDEEGFFATLFQDITEHKKAAGMVREKERDFPDMVARYNLELKHTFCNQAVESHLGEPPDYFLGKTFLDLKKEGELGKHFSTMQKKLEKCLETGEEQVFEQSLVLASERKHFSISILPEIDGEGNIEALLAITRDITEWKKAEEQRRFFGAILENISDSLVVTDSRHNISYINKKTEELFGYSLEEIKGCPINVLNPEKGEKPPGQEFFGGEIRKKKDGSTFLSEFKRLPLSEENGEPYSFVEIHRDVTERKEMEKALAESEERYRQLFEESPISLWEQDYSQVKKALETIKEQGVEDIENFLSPRPDLVFELSRLVRVVKVNNATLKLYGFKSKDDFFSGFNREFTPKVQSDMVDSIVAIEKGNTFHESERTQHTFNGDELRVQFFWTVAPGHEETYSRVLAGVVDNTEQKRIEENLKKTKEKVEKLHETALAMSKSKKEKDVYQMVLDSTVNILGHKLCTFALSEGNMLRVKAATKPVNRDIEVHKGIAGRTFLTGQTLVSNNVLEEKKVRLSSPSYKAIISTPVGDIGVFQVVSTIESAFSKEDVKLVELISNHAAEAIKRIRAEENIKHISFHDSLTGLYNRYFLEAEMKRLDTERQLPISVIMADLNGLKLVNDTYGHDTGDEMLKGIAQILKKSCRKEDLIARWGGDEFVILLPQTDMEQTNNICQRIMHTCAGAFVKEVPVSISMGYSSKESKEQELFSVLKEAEDKMYRHKLTESRSAKSAALAALLRTLSAKSFETEAHTRRMQNIAIKIGQKLGLPESELRRLELLITLHDIGKINISEEILTKNGPLTDEEWKVMKKHSEIGHRIAQATPDFAHVAEDILAHHEKWDGSGYPRGLKGKNIPLLARIAAIADAYEVMSNGRPYKEPMSKDAIIEEFRKCSGTHFDPKLVEVFLEIIDQEEQ